MNKNILVSAIFLSTFLIFQLQAQQISLVFEQSSCTLTGIELNQKKLFFSHPDPFFSVLIDSSLYNSSSAGTFYHGDTIFFKPADSVYAYLIPDKGFKPGLRYVLRFLNNGKANHRIENLVPLGEGPGKVFISAGGTKEWPHYLCRSLLYRPGYGPVGVILPDNAWHLGFCDLKLNDSLSLVSLARRTGRDKDKSSTDRWAMTLKPGGWVEYSIYVDIHSGEWQEGLRLMFQQRWLYDLSSFDNSMFERKDLSWMKNKYLMLLQFAWDDKYYDYREHKYNFYSSLTEYDDLTGGYDIYTLWPTWPRLGLDRRNQWDMYRDLPGGLKELRKQAEFAHRKGKKYFISYNPWDEGTRKEDQMKGMEFLLRETDADGVVLDTKGESSRELQATADQVKPGIIMYSEGMAIPKDMPGIVSGRVHDALVMPPPLNLNKFIKPDFAIFRVLQLADDRLHRELACAFFNGYGVEINTMKPGRPEWIREEYEYLGKTTMILRENTSVFHNYKWLPLIPTETDSVYVNRWESGNKTLYTLFSLNPRGWDAPLFKVPDPVPGFHYVDLWNHLELNTTEQNMQSFIRVQIEAFNRSFLNSRMEGSTGCIAHMPVLINARDQGDTLFFSAGSGDKIKVFSGNPSYHSKPYEFTPAGGRLPYRKIFGESCPKLVIQLFEKEELLDEQIISPSHDKPRLVSGVTRTPASKFPPKTMAEIPEGKFKFYTHRDQGSQDAFIAFPDHNDTVVITIHKFYMDKYPVTNIAYYHYIQSSKYRPTDTTAYLRHWKNGQRPFKEDENKPVVNLSLEDARKYCNTSGKRLPSEAEWQYAAQGTDLRKYPWGNLCDSSCCNVNLNHETEVNAFPKGASPFGIEDMIGNVWQMTGDVYYNGSYYYNIIRGGSYYHPTQSMWYVTGGPMPAYHPEMLLLISPGLDRNSTVGFRCVKDAD